MRRPEDLAHSVAVTVGESTAYGGMKHLIFDVGYRAVTTRRERLEGMAVRWEVFVKEQSVPPVLEVDARDFLFSTTHILAVAKPRGFELQTRHSCGFPISKAKILGDQMDAGAPFPVGTARLLRDGETAFHVGRVAVCRNFRGHAIGRRLMRFAEQHARSSVPAGKELSLTLDAQVSAQDFYTNLGYEPTERDRFLDAGILHQEMRLITVGEGV